MPSLSRILKTLVHAVFGVTPALCGIFYGMIAPFTEASDFALLNVVIVPLGIVWWKMSYNLLR